MAFFRPFTLYYLSRLRPTKIFIWSFLVAILFCFYFKYPLPTLFLWRVPDESLLLTNIQYPSLNPDLYPLESLKSDCQEHNLSTYTAVSSFPPIEPSETRKDTSSSVLLVTSSVDYRYLIIILEHLLVPYEVCRLTEIPRLNTSPLLDRLERTDALPIGLIIFEDFASYTGLPSWQRHTLDDYCRSNKIGIIGFLNDGRSFSTEPDSVSRIGNLPLYLHRLSTHPWGFYVANNASMLRITRSGRMRPGRLVFPEHPSQGITPRCCQATLVPWPGFEKHFVPLLFTRVTAGSGHPTMLSSCVLSMNASSNETHNEVYQSLILEDLGLVDGIRKVLFAMSADSFWPNSMVILDAIISLGQPFIHASPLISVPPNSPSDTAPHNTSLKSGIVPYGLTRWILIDIDDVFNVGAGGPYTADDALALLLAQHRWRQWISNFTFNLGFCGQYFEYPNNAEVPGYRRLLQYRDNFWWFDHLWNHQQAHQLSRKQLVEYMYLNKKFAEKYSIPVRYAYAVSPYHSGIFPVLDSLYDAWKEVWNVTATSTQQYPRVFMMGPRRGFRFNGIQVLPRQTCGVYSQYVRLRDFPGGYDLMRRMIFGGSLFFTVLYNPFSIFMTHLPNFKGDRLALVIFDALFEFLRDWTNLRLRTAPPTELAQLYSQQFDKWGANDAPLHTDPCADHHTRALWPSVLPCGSDLLPHLVITGPQKTGTTALMNFLRLHPSFSANHFQSGTTFEELQFFSSDPIYARGIVWYMNQFDRHPNHSTRIIRFEKSATYFANSKTPARLRSLIPGARVIVMLDNPITRAHSWYQHSLAHNDSAAKLISFTNLLRFGRDLTAKQLSQLVTKARLKELRISLKNTTAMAKMAASIQSLYRRCLEPGAYASHLSLWLKYFPPTQILLLDSQVFKTSPIVSLRIVVQFLGLPDSFNFSEYLHFDSKKGFFCLRPGRHYPLWPGTNVHLRSCLGSSKGRRYKHLDPLTEVPVLLRTYFNTANVDLYYLLRRQPSWRQWLAKAGYEYPEWLIHSLNISVPGPPAA